MLYKLPNSPNFGLINTVNLLSCTRKVFPQFISCKLSLFFSFIYFKFQINYCKYTNLFVPFPLLYSIIMQLLSLCLYRQLGKQFHDFSTVPGDLTIFFIILVFHSSQSSLSTFTQHFPSPTIVFLLLAYEFLFFIIQTDGWNADW